MKRLNYLSIAIVCVFLPSCGFLDDELLTEDSIFGVGGIGLEGTGTSSCGGFSMHRSTRYLKAAPAIGAQGSDEANIQEFDMDDMVFMSTQPSGPRFGAQNAKVISNDEVIGLFVRAENQVDSAIRKSELEGVH